MNARRDQPTPPAPEAGWVWLPAWESHVFRERDGAEYFVRTLTWFRVWVGDDVTETTDDTDG